MNETMVYHSNSVGVSSGGDKGSGGESLQSAADSSKEEEVRAICARHGVTPRDTLAKVLKAVDTVSS